MNDAALQKYHPEQKPRSFALSYQQYGLRNWLVSADVHNLITDKPICAIPICLWQANNWLDCEQTIEM